MRKLKFALALLMVSPLIFAQDDDDVLTKNGQPILPQAGDWALGIDANPFLNYLGNFIGGTDNNTAPTWNYLTTNQTIMGKYFVSDDMAYRGALRIGFGSNNDVQVVLDRSQAPPTYPDLPDMVENEMKMSSTNIALAGGVEWRKGNGRLQGIYGGELGFSISSSKTTYTYGNDLDPGGTPAVTVDPVADAFGGGSNITTDTYGNTARITEMKNGSTFGVGARAFIGAEYFVLPKISLGGEFGWGVVFSSTGAGSTTLESTQGTETGEQTMETGSSSNFGLDTDNVNSIFGPSAVLRIMFHFSD